MLQGEDQKRIGKLHSCSLGTGEVEWGTITLESERFNECQPIRTDHAAEKNDKTGFKEANPAIQLTLGVARRVLRFQHELRGEFRFIRRSVRRPQARKVFKGRWRPDVHD